MTPEFISAGKGFEQAASASEYTLVAVQKSGCLGSCSSAFWNIHHEKVCFFLRFVLLLTATFGRLLPLRHCSETLESWIITEHSSMYLKAAFGQTGAVVLHFLVFLDLIASFLVLLITSKTKLLCSAPAFHEQTLAALGLATHSGAELWAEGSWGVMVARLTVLPLLHDAEHRP